MAEVQKKRLRVCELYTKPCIAVISEIRMCLNVRLAMYVKKCMSASTVGILCFLIPRVLGPPYQVAPLE